MLLMLLIAPGSYMKAKQGPRQKTRPLGQSLPAESTQFGQELTASGLLCQHRRLIARVVNRPRWNAGLYA